jgi:type IV pilus assembly protein PilW
MKRTFTLQARRRAAGFSMIEIMVASTIGLVVTLAVIGSVLTMGRQFSVVGANVAAQGSAQIALSLLDSAGRSAGAGFYNNGKLLCQTWNAYNGTALVADGAVFMPVRITAGASTSKSDTVTFTAATGAGALSSAPVLVDSAGATDIKVSASGNLAIGDLALVGVPSAAQNCTLIQVTGVTPQPTAASCGGNATSCSQLARSAGTGLNPGAGTFTTVPAYGFTTAGSAFGPAVVSRVGTAAAGFRQDAFALQCNSLVRFNAFTTPTPGACTPSPLGFATGVDAIATDIVTMQAQYGVSASGASDVVLNWVEPSGATWGTPNAANVARIKAVRIVLVARSKEPEVADVSSACTNANSVANTGPCSFQDAEAPVIDLSGTTVAAGKTWKNYRYRVHQSVIPLRNVIWSDS